MPIVMTFNVRSFKHQTSISVDELIKKFCFNWTFLVAVGVVYRCLEKAIVNVKLLLPAIINNYTTTKIKIKIQNIT